MTAPSPAADEVPTRAGDEALAAVHVGLWASAIRCLLTYVVAPAAGALGLLLGPVGLLLQVAGAVTSTASARRLWPLGHRLRLPYAAVAVVIDVVTVLALAQWLADVVTGASR